MISNNNSDKLDNIRKDNINKLKNLNIFKNDDIINNLELNIYNYSNKYSNNKKVNFIIYIYNHKFNNILNDIIKNDLNIYYIITDNNK
jgi:hypothetical protein